MQQEHSPRTHLQLLARFPFSLLKKITFSLKYKYTIASIYFNPHHKNLITYNCLLGLIGAQLSDLCEEGVKKLLFVIHLLFLFAAMQINNGQVMRVFSFISKRKWRFKVPSARPWGYSTQVSLTHAAVMLTRLCCNFVCITYTCTWTYTCMSRFNFDRDWANLTWIYPSKHQLISNISM